MYLNICCIILTACFSSHLFFFFSVIPGCVFLCQKQSRQRSRGWQQQEGPDVSTNELDKGALVLRNLGEELSVPPSATIPSAQPSEIVFFGGAGRAGDVVIHRRKTSLRYQKAGRWSMLEIWGFLGVSETLWHNIYARQAARVTQSYYSW